MAKSRRKTGDRLKVGLADWLGLIAALLAVTWVPILPDPGSYPKLLVLAAGGLAAAPAAVHRWRSLPRPPVAILIPCAAAAGIVMWTILSAVVSGAPWGVSLFGWWLRADGLLATVGAASLLLGAATLTSSELRRLVTWILGGASVVALLGVAQAMGAPILGSGGGVVLGSMGNQNYAAGYFAIVLALALGRALTPGSRAPRIWAGVLALVLAVLQGFTDSTQGPIAMVAGLAGFGLAWVFLDHGSRRRQGMVVAGTLGAGVVVLVAFSMRSGGPISQILADVNTQARLAAWETGWNVLRGMPVFGTGPAGLARYFGEYRTEFLVEIAGPDARPSAVHNIALQFGVTTGWVGLILWIALVVGAASALLSRMFRGPVRSAALTASVAGALVAYITQGMVSVDTPPLLGTGWLVMGMAVALAREPAFTPLPVAVDRPSGRRKSKRTVVAGSPVTRGTGAPRWVPATAVVVGLAGCLMVGKQLIVVQSAFGDISTESVAGLVSDPVMPCALRVDIVNDAVEQLPASVSVPVVLAATAVDPRCPPMVHIRSEAALGVDDLALAETSTEEGVALDPLFARAWLLRAVYLQRAGDDVGAEIANAEAQRLIALFPGDAATN